MKTDFFAPDGSRVQQVSNEFLKDLVLNSGPEYWNSTPATGDSALEQDVDGRIRTMSLVFKEPFGFRIVYWGFEGDDWFVAACKDDWSDTTEIVLGGESAKLPIAFLIPRPLAWDVIREFVESGSMCQKVRWVDEANELG